MTDFIWRPEEHPWTRDSHVARFMAQYGFKAFAELHAASVKDTAWFWEAAMRDMGVEWYTPYTQVRDDSRGFPWTKWFIGGQVNITHNCVDRHVRDGHGAETAIYYEPDSGRPEDRRTMTFADLKAQVDHCAAALRAMGVGRGDCVGLYAPMRPETVVVMFATFKIGARFVPIFCGFGEQAVVDRLESCGAKILFALEHLHRRGKAVPVGATALAAAKRVPSIVRTVFFDTGEWGEFCRSGFTPDMSGIKPDLQFARTSAEDPCLIIYTSGTTGKPKGTVHTHGGCLAQMGKELRYAFDVRPGDPFFWVTDIGWMMGPWELIGCLLYRTPVVVLDGAPDYPDGDRLWEIVARLKVVTFAVSPTAVRLLMRLTGVKGPGAFDLSRLRILGSTGEPWDETSYAWFFEHIGRRRCPVMNISGGTEIVGCHLSPTPLTPLKPISLGAAGLGMDVDVFDEEGRPAPRGTVGHLVCKQPAPSMTRSFLGDDARYLETYFSRFPGVWYHGDWAMQDADGQWFLFGRSDDTIKVAGKRVGPAEVEGVLTSHPAVSEAATIGVPDDLKGQALVCFVVLKGGAACHQGADDARDGVVHLEKELIAHVAAQLGKPLAPKTVVPVAALPKTRSGKVVRGSIRKAWLGEPSGDLSTVDNPTALDAIRAAGGGKGGAP
ncbi:MAG TPA: AMP-binding protein [Lacunisphaera sp.]|nr:AMP-binding protein [Lacunisphaera sp.]